MVSCIYASFKVLKHRIVHKCFKLHLHNFCKMCSIYTNMYLYVCTNHAIIDLVAISLEMTIWTSTDISISKFEAY